MDSALAGGKTKREEELEYRVNVPQNLWPKKPRKRWWRGMGPETAGSISRTQVEGKRPQTGHARLKVSKKDPHGVKSQTPGECRGVGGQGPKRQDTSLTWLVTWKRNREHHLATNCPGLEAAARCPPPPPAASSQDPSHAHLRIGLQRQPALTLHGHSAGPFSSSDSRRRFRPLAPDLDPSNPAPRGRGAERLRKV